VVADRGTNIVKALNDSTVTQAVPCMMHVMHRVVLAGLDEINCKVLFKKLAQLGGHFAQSATTKSYFEMWWADNYPGKK
jgi:hypothetical protein